MERTGSGNRPGLAVTGVGVLSPLGVGWQEFRAKVSAATPGHLIRWEADGDPVPFAQAYTVPPHDPTVWLGTKGLRYLDRATILVLTAAHMALTHAGYAITEENEHDIGVALGTSMGSIEGITELGRDTFIQPLPYQVSSMRAPLSVVNAMASYIAIWYKARGVNATVCAGRLSGLSALRFATVAMRAGRCRACLVGAVENLCVPFAWISHHADQAAEPINREAEPYFVGEGCGMLLLEELEHARDAGRTPLVEVVDCVTGFAGTHTDVVPVDVQATGLASLLADLLDRHGVDREAIATVAVGSQGARHRERPAAAAVEKVLGVHPGRRILALHEQSGDCYSAAGALQLAAVIALLLNRPPADSYGLTVSVDPEGGIGCALLRRCEA